MYKRFGYKERVAVLVSLALLFSSCLMGCSDADLPSGSSYYGLSVLEVFECLEGEEDMPITITERAKDILEEKPELFDKNNTGVLLDEYDEYIDYELDYRAVMKNINMYGDKLMYIPEAYVISVAEDTIDGQAITEMELMDADEKTYYVVGLTAYDDIYEDDVVECYALPLGDTSYENIGGGTTISLVLAGSCITKLY